ncbi:MAG: patatin-like phospholipase family protein [Deltaproteobacteria bacterium]|nr:patatin-like phospholipase family protein [Deltaproteobacteria bacterium]
MADKIIKIGFLRKFSLVFSIKAGLKYLCLAQFIFFIAGCSSYGKIANVPRKENINSRDYYAIDSHVKRNKQRSNDIGLGLAFSGGGTRAAAFSYGVLEALRDTGVVIDSRSERLLDEVDVISSVSGGSFTAAYYGLYGDAIFADFEEVFLRNNIESELVRGLFNPVRWFDIRGRTEMAIKHYDEHVFYGATFADMNHDDRPLIVLNASDISHGVRFSFIQEYFDLICSDMSQFPISRAVTASSAVPVLFNPVVLENYSGCMTTKPDWLESAINNSSNNLEMDLVVNNLESYFNQNKGNYTHLVDGGVTDNLGLRAIYEVIELAGGVKLFLKSVGQKLPRRIVIIAVNASTDPGFDISATNKTPSLKEMGTAISNIQLHRYNAATMALMKRALERWAKELSTPEQEAVPYFIQLNFRQIKTHQKRSFLNAIPTSFSLNDKQVDGLIEAGREMLLANPEFQRLLTDIGDSQ